MSTEAEDTSAAPAGDAAPGAEGTPPADAAAVAASSTEGAEGGEATETAPEEGKPTADAWAKFRGAEDRMRTLHAEHKAAVKAGEERATALTAREKELDDRAKTFSLGHFNGDRDAFMRHHGFTYDEWTRDVLDHTPADAKQNDAIAKLTARVEAFEKRDEEAKAAAQTRGAETHWDNVMGNLAVHIAPPKAVEGAAPVEHRYELLHDELAAAPEFVADTIRAMAELDGAMTIEQAADKYEAHLFAQTKRRLGLSKVRALFPSGETKPSTDANQAETNGTATGNGSSTLSHTDSSERSADPPPRKEWHEMSMKERRDEDKAQVARAQRALEQKDSAAG